MKLNPKQMEKAMRRMGMQMEQIDAEKVIIKTSDKDIVISNPSVSKINMMGQEVFQITGNTEEGEKFSEEDVQMVADQAGVSVEEAKRVLDETNDIAEAILRLKKQ